MGELSYTTGGDSNLVSFKSAARVPITSLKAHFKPKQDLHGYSKPWIGGTGKNLLQNTRTPMTYSTGGITFTTCSDGRMIIDGTAERSAVLILNNSLTLPTGSYILSGCPSDGSINHFSLVTYNGIDTEDTGSSATFTLSESTTFKVRIEWEANASFNNSIFYPMIRLASNNDATWEPYENICPIEGWNNVDYYIKEENLFKNITIVNGYKNDSGVTVASQNSYYISTMFDIDINNLDAYKIIYETTGDFVFRLYFFDDEGQWISRSQSMMYTIGAPFLISIDNFINFPQDCKKIQFQFNKIVDFTKVKLLKAKTVSTKFPILGKNKLPIGTTTFTNYKEYTLDNPIPAGKYIISATITSTDTDDTQSLIQLLNKNGAVMNSIRFIRNERRSLITTTYQDVYFIRLYAARTPETSIDDECTWTEVQMELGTELTEYEPYNPDNTVYGGYVDIAKGELVQEWLCVNLSDLNWQYNANWNMPNIKYADDFKNLNIIKATTSASQYGEMVAEKYTLKPYSDMNANLEPGHIIFANTARLFASVSDQNEEIEGLACFKLITPIVYKFSPTQLQTLLGQNNIWTDTNSGTEVSYALHDTAPIRAAKHRIAANEPHIETVTGTLVSFETDMKVPIESAKIYFNPVQEGSGDPSPENIRNIDGWREIKWYQSNKVIVDCEFGTINGNTTEEVESSNTLRTKGYFILQPNNTYNFNLISNRSTAQFFRLFSYNMSNQQLEYSNRLNSSSFQTIIGTAYGTQPIKARFTIKNSDSSDFDFNDMSNTLVEISNIINTYQSSIGPTTLDWSSVAGTLYGGYIDLITGELVQTHYKLTFDGTENIMQVTDMSSSSITPLTYVNFDSSSNNKIARALNGSEQSQIMTSFYSHGQYALSTTDQTYHGFAADTVSHTKTIVGLFLPCETNNITNYLSAQYNNNTPVEICYPLLSPIHYQLSPQTLKTLKGQNNIWSNSNGPIDIKYWTH